MCSVRLNMRAGEERGHGDRKRGQGGRGGGRVGRKRKEEGGGVCRGVRWGEEVIGGGERRR